MKVGTLLLLVITCCKLGSADYLCIGKIGPMGISQSEADDISRLIKQLHSRSQEERNETKKSLLVAAMRSPAARREVIGGLIGVLNSARRVVEGEVSFDTWAVAAQLTGELGAEEAIDALIEYLDFSDGTYGLSLSHWPATRAVIEMGNAAIPKLVRALEEGKASVRAKAALALGEIGGDRSEQALEGALLTEKDEEVIFNIETSLSTISKRRRRQ